MNSFSIFPKRTKRQFYRVRNRIYKLLNITFDHHRAQEYEVESALSTIAEHFQSVYESWEKAYASGSLCQSADDLWFNGDTELFKKFVDHVRARKCLEIGSGPFGYLARCYWIVDRIIIDPLIDRYREAEMAQLGKTFFTSEIRAFNANAEPFIEEFRNKVDGCIVCQNTLDHCKDPLQILDNISEYAAPGCYLLLWTDIWHLAGPDSGHRNITGSEVVLDKVLRGLGFKILKTAKKIRDPNQYIEFGRLAQKI